MVSSRQVLLAVAASVAMIVPLEMPAAAVDSGRVPPAEEPSAQDIGGTAERLSDSEPFTASGAPTLPRPQILLDGGGWGHGVGMSQYGARAMAEAGHSHRQILQHYYPGVSLETRATPSRFRVGLLNPDPPGAGDRRFDFSRARVYTEPSNAQRVAWQRCSAAGSCATVGEQIAGVTWRAERGSDGRLRVVGGDGTVVYQQTASHDVAYLRVRMSGQTVQVREKPGLPGSNGRSYRRGELQVRPSPRNGSDVMIGVQLADSSLASAFDQYLWGLGEVPFSWHTNALKAQVLAARTFAARHQQIGGCACDITDGPDTQVYRGFDWERGATGSRWRDAVNQTSREVVTQGGGLVSAFYSSSHSRRSENVQDSWAYTATTTQFPYLRSVADPWSSDWRAGNPNVSWIAQAGHRDFARLVAPSLAVVTRVEVIARTTGGSPATLRVSGFDAAGARRQVTFSGSPTYPVAAAVLRQSLPASGDGSWGGRLKSQQLERIGLAPFVDDFGGVHEYAAIVLHSRGITRGCTADRYCPSDPNRRDHMARFLTTALDLPPGEKMPFTDVPADSEFRADIAAVYHAGITLGHADGTFRPRENVTRGEMASFLVRGYGYPAAGDQGFTDVTASSHQDAINALAAAGVTTGYTDGTYRPQANVRRGEMASFIARALGYDL